MIFFNSAMCTSEAVTGKGFLSPSMRHQSLRVVPAISIELFVRVPGWCELVAECPPLRYHEHVRGNSSSGNVTSLDLLVKNLRDRVNAGVVVGITIVLQYSDQSASSKTSQPMHNLVDRRIKYLFAFYTHTVSY